MAENTERPGAGAGPTAPSVRAPSSDQQPATKADLYAAVDALRNDMHELMDMVRTLIAEADRRVSDLERAEGAGAAGPAGPAGPAGGGAGPRARFDDDEW